jgi:hypothetical protein
MLEEMIKQEIKEYIIKHNLKGVINNMVKEKLSDENIKKTVEMEINKLLPNAISESIRYELEDNSAINEMVYYKLKEMVKNKISDWKIEKDN